MDKAEEYAAEGIDSGIAGDIAGDMAGGIAENYDNLSQSVDNQSNVQIDWLDAKLSATIAGGIADKLLRILKYAKIDRSRKELLLEIGLVNNANNFETYIQPLVAINWLTMTIPDKPTSPKQKYLTTLKGHLVLALLQRKNG